MACNNKNKYTYKVTKETSTATSTETSDCATTFVTEVSSETSTTYTTVDTTGSTKESSLISSATSTTYQNTTTTQPQTTQAAQTNKQTTTTTTTTVNTTTSDLPTSAETQDSTTTTETTKPLVVKYYSEQDVLDIARVMYSECRGVPSKTEQACVAWTVLNRVDADGTTIYSAVRKRGAFAFNPKAPVWDSLKSLSRDVLDRWSREKDGETNVGRVLPKNYLYFYGKNGHNYFRDNYKKPYNIWNYSLESPYEN